MSKKTEKNDEGFWPAFLPGVEKAIAAALDSVALQEKALAALTETSRPEAGPGLDSLRDRIFGLGTYVDRPRQESTELDSALQTSENQVRAYLQEVEGLRQKLVDWAGGAIR